MELEHRIQGNIAVIKLSGKIMQPDHREAIIAKFTQYLKEYGKDRFIIDLSGVTMMNSQGLGALIGSLRDIQGASGRAAIIGYEKLEPLMITGNLARYFHMYHDEERALAFLSE